MNHHGKTIVHETEASPTPSGNEAHGMYANKDLFAVDESVQREALKNFYEQRAGVEKKKLRNAMWISYWGVPILVIVFVVTYWIMGIENYLNPSISVEEEAASMTEEEEEGGGSVWLILGLIGLLIIVFAALLWWCHPMISARLQKKKKTKLGSQQTLVRSKIAL